MSGCVSVEPPDLEPVSFESGTNDVRLSFVGRYTFGFFDIGAATPAAYDPETQRLFVVAVDRGLIDTLDISDPSEPRLIARKLVLGYGGFPSSVDLENGALAVALRGVINTLPGKVLFFDVDGRRIAPAVRVGTKPIKLAYTPAGRELVVANQGEANSQYTIDPNGSVSIIDLGLSDPDCRGEACDIDPEAVLLDFRGFNDRRDELIAEGVRIFGPNASVAQDLEPEAVAIAPDGDTAWVSLQRNNAMAVIDLPGRSIADIFALGTKDHSLAENALDASDRDGGIDIRPWPLRSFYQPDMLAAYAVSGSTYLVTPNEGDPRDFDGFSEDVRVRNLRLDAAAFPDAADLQADSNLGRLRVTNAMAMPTATATSRRSSRSARARSRSGRRPGSWSSTVATISSASWPTPCRGVSTARTARSPPTGKAPTAGPNRRPLRSAQSGIDSTRSLRRSGSAASMSMT